MRLPRPRAAERLFRDDVAVADGRDGRDRPPRRRSVGRERLRVRDRITAAKATRADHGEEQRGEDPPGLEAAHGSVRRVPDQWVGHGCSLRDSPGASTRTSTSGTRSRAAATNSSTGSRRNRSARAPVERPKRAPVDRDGDPRPQQRDRDRRACRVEMTGAEARPPAPDRHEGEVEIGDDPLQAGRSCRRRRTRGRSRAVRSRRVQPALSSQLAARRARHAWHARPGRQLELIARQNLAHVGESLLSHESSEASGDDDRYRARQLSQRGQVVVVPVRDQDGVDGGLGGSGRTSVASGHPPPQERDAVRLAPRRARSAPSSARASERPPALVARRRGRAVAKALARVVRKVEPDAPGCSTAVNA